MVFAIIQLNLSLRITNYFHFNSFNIHSISNDDLRSEEFLVNQEENGGERISFEFSVQPKLQTVVNTDTMNILDSNSDLDRESDNELASKSQLELVEEFNKKSKLESNEEMNLESDEDSNEEASQEQDSKSKTELDKEQVEELKEESEQESQEESKEESKEESQKESKEESQEESKEESQKEPEEEPEEESRETLLPDSTTNTIDDSHSDPSNKPSTQSSFKQTERPKKAKFNPVGIPFSKKTWFSLFRYYQQIMRSESTVSPDLLHSQTNFFSILPGDKVQFLHIPNGCVNLYKRQIIILRNKPDHSFTKTNLRSPNILQEVPLDSPIPGFESLPLFLSDATSIPYPTLSSNLTWLFYTPNKEHTTNECMNSLASYLSLFFHSIHPLLPIDVLLFSLQSFIAGVRDCSFLSYFSKTALLQIRVWNWAFFSLKPIHSLVWEILSEFLETSIHSMLSKHCRRL